jgi:LmbE family N-acetylglucosaminyl deacetylase
VLGCSRVEALGYPDSGMDGVGGPPDAFSRLSPEGPAGRLASVLKEENADVLVGYDPAGGYGHPDHVQVHRVARMAASMVPVPLVLEATVDRRALQVAAGATRLLRRAQGLVPGDPRRQFADPTTITHSVDVARFTAAKRSAIAAHASQTTADGGERSLAWLLRLPAPVFRVAMGREWFTEVGRTPGRRRLGDPLASLR